jgi:hypothetical protein
MPMIKIQYDDAKLSESEVRSVSEAIRRIVQSATEIEDVFVYANCAQINVAIAPIEIFVEMSAHKIKDEDELVKVIRNELARWKQESGFSQPINLTLIPMHWKIEVEI